MSRKDYWVRNEDWFLKGEVLANTPEWRDVQNPGNYPSVLDGPKVEVSFTPKPLDKRVRRIKWANVKHDSSDCNREAVPNN
jgi:hypothetical protein